MKILLYANDLKRLGWRLKDMIHTQASEMQVNVYSSIDHFSQILQQPLNNVTVVILIVASRDELVQFNSKKALFDNIRVILMLPDRKEETLSLGLKMKTSFVSYVDSDLQDVASVLAQIQKNKGE
ncbi:MAG: hypothetical protein GY699_25570 [Desulfobacteraceae bacterium]|nr:hypothetical protein [Desulfobacteraceae bacterium]